MDVTIASGEARFRAVQRLPQDVLTQSQMLIKLYALSRHSKFTVWIHRSTRVEYSSKHTVPSVCSGGRNTVTYLLLPSDLTCTPPKQSMVLLSRRLAQGATRLRLGHAMPRGAIPRGAVRTCASAVGDAAPTTRQLLLHARLAAVPMVGFGFMDNIIMIQAGDYIDATLGVTLGFSTLVAAALGNVCSDSSGVLFGGVVESASARLNLTQAQLTVAQARMPITRRAATVGQLVGVICGCFLGMTNLFFMDLEATERLKRAQQLETVFEPVMTGLQSIIAAERCTLFLFDEDKRELWTKIATAKGGSGSSGGMIGGAKNGDASSSFIARLSLDEESLVSSCARTGALLNIADAHKDVRHDGKWDRQTGFVTKAVLCHPIVDEEGKLYGCIQAVNKTGGGRFTTDDEKLMKMLSHHITVFIQAIG